MKICLKIKVEDGYFKSGSKVNLSITLTLPNLTKSYKDYLHNISHMVLQTCPNLSTVPSRKAYLSKQIPWHPAGDSCLALGRSWVEPQLLQACCACIFSPCSVPSPFGRDSSLHTFPTNSVDSFGI